jgi:xanthine dehydrogenase small subunit
MFEQNLSFILNEKMMDFCENPAFLTLDFLRSRQKLMGTKEGCREGDCGACTVLLGEMIAGKVKYKTVVSCLLPLGEIDRKHLVTIEGLNQKKINFIQESIMNEGATQCGFCTPGIVISLTGFLLNSSNLNITEAIDSIEGNICRCTGYVSLKRVCASLINKFSKILTKSKDRVPQLIEYGILPDYFRAIPIRLKRINENKPQKFPQISKKITIVGGATDLYVQKHDDILERDLLLISKFKKFKGISVNRNSIHVGAVTTVEDLMNSTTIKKYLPDLAGYLKLISSTQIRNQATVAGNIMNASPIGDLSIILLGLNSDIILFSEKGNRRVPLKDFFLGYKKLNIRSNEIAGLLSIPKVKAMYFNFEKVSRRKYLDIASVNSAIGIKLKNKLISEINISAGGVSPTPLFLKKTSKFLIGKEMNVLNIKNASTVMSEEISPISDVRGSIEYKKLLLRQLFIAHFIKIFPEKFTMEDFL